MSFSIIFCDPLARFQGHGISEIKYVKSDKR